MRFCFTASILASYRGYMRSCYHRGCDSGSNPNLRKPEAIKFLAKTAQAVVLAVADLAGGIEACDLSSFYSVHQTSDEPSPEQPHQDDKPEAENFLQEELGLVQQKNFTGDLSPQNLLTPVEDFDDLFEQTDRQDISMQASGKKTNKDSNLGLETLLKLLLDKYLTKYPENSRNDLGPQNVANREVFSGDDQESRFGFEGQVLSCALFLLIFR